MKGIKSGDVMPMKSKTNKTYKPSITLWISATITVLAMCIIALSLCIEEAFILMIARFISRVGMFMCATVLTLIIINIIRFPLKRKLLVNGCFICAFTISIIIFSLFLKQTDSLYYQKICEINLRNLNVAFYDYVQVNGQYPPSNIWRTEMLNFANENPDRYTSNFSRNMICPGSYSQEYSYAMNPDASVSSDPDTVLLFESKDESRQFGTEEVATFENHDGNGCNVLFVNGQIKYVSKQEFKNLKW